MVLAYNPSRKTRVIWIMLSKGTFILIFFHAFHNVVKTFTKSHLIIYQAWQLVKTQDNFSCNSKSMGIHLAHNIRIKLPQMKKKNASWLSSIQFTFFKCLFAASESGALLTMPHLQNFQLQKAEYQNFLLEYHLFLD